MADPGAPSNSDVIVIGAGLAGLVAANELADAGRQVVVLDQEPEASLGGQAFWALGGLFLVGSPEQRRLGVKDTVEKALQDWMRYAEFDRGVDDRHGEDYWARQWATAYVNFAAGENRAWLRKNGVRFFPVVGWAERNGNSVPRFHLTWGSGPGLVQPFARRARARAAEGLVRFAFRHRADELLVTNGTVTGVRGTVLEPSNVARGTESSRAPVGEFELHAQAVIVTSGGMGANHDLVRAHWPARLGAPPKHLLTGVPAHVDGRMLAITERAGGRLVNRDRMWHYTEGIANWAPIWPHHGIRVLAGPSSLWLDARGQRLLAPNFPGFDTLGTLKAIGDTGYDHTWFVLTKKIIQREFALSGSEQNPDLTAKDVRQVLQRATSKLPAPVQAFLDRGPDFVVAGAVAELVEGMNKLSGNPVLDPAEVEGQIRQRDREMAQRPPTDPQVLAIRKARRYLGDRLVRVAPPHPLLDPAMGPLIAVRLRILTRKTLGGLQTDLSGRVLRPDGAPLPGLYAAGEVAGFGGGGVHGYRSLEGTFLGGCLFSGRAAGRAVARALA